MQEKKPEVLIKIKNGGEIRLELMPDKAPLTVKNFLDLVARGFYDGLTFHRIIAGFMIQGGDPLGNGTGGSEHQVKGEFKSNGVDNDLSHERGVISMARSMNPNSASSQFFICHADAKFLDGEYAAFGRVLAGFEELDRLASLQTNHQDYPLDVPVIESISLVQA